MKEFTYASKGIGKIHGCLWEPEGEPKFIVQIVHGVAEYVLRYAPFAEFLASRGGLVAAEDHMGHGKSIEDHTPLYFEGGWDTAVEDTCTLLLGLRKKFPDLPCFLFGHSMGSFMARDILFRHPEAGLRGAIICGTGWQPRFNLVGGRALCAMECRRLGDKNPSKLLHNIMFGAFNKQVENPRTPNDWICTRREVVDAYTADPLCGGMETSGLARDMIYGLRRIQTRKNLDNMPKNLPVFFVSGKSDPVGNMGKGVVKAAEAFRKAGMKQVSLRLYDGRHEILNEANRTEVQEDLWAFMRNLL